MARSVSRCPPCAAGSITQVSPLASARTLPRHRSPWMRDGGSRRADDLGDAGEESLEGTCRAVRHRSLVDRLAQVRLDPSCDVEVRPVVRRCVVERQRTDVAVRRRAERRRAESVHRGEGATERLVGLRRTTPRCRCVRSGSRGGTRRAHEGRAGRRAASPPRASAVRSPRLRRSRAAHPPAASRRQLATQVLEQARRRLPPRGRRRG